MSEENVFPEAVIVPLDELREKLCLVPVDVLRQMLAPQGLQVVSSAALVVPPGHSAETLNGLHRALDVLVALFIARAPLGTSPLLTRTSVMDLMQWSHANLSAAQLEGAGDQ